MHLYFIRKKFRLNKKKNFRAIHAQKHEKTFPKSKCLLTINFFLHRIKTQNVNQLLKIQKNYFFLLEIYRRFNLKKKSIRSQDIF